MKEKDPIKTLFLLHNKCQIRQSESPPLSTRNMFETEKFTFYVHVLRAKKMKKNSTNM